MTPEIPRFGAARVTAVWLATCAAVSLPASEKLSEAVRATLPRYDPTLRQAAEAKRAAEASAPAESPVLKTPEERAAPSRAVTLVVEPNVVQLAPFVVRQKRPKEALQKLPRIEVAAPVNASVDTSDPMLSPEERLRRVRKKWGSPVDFFLLNWLFGSGADVGAEARERYAGQLGKLADEIELAAAAGATPEEIKQLREYYLQLYLARPK